MPHPVALLNLVGLSPALIGEHTPTIAAFARRSGGVRTLRPTLPALTTTVQSSMFTGVEPNQHGIVANGWFNREQQEVQFWKQSNRLVEAEKVWETARKRDPSFTCANICCWYAMYSSCDVTVTPRPIYCADGRKIPDCWTDPPELRDRLQKAFGTFPLFRFWGPAADIESTRWIADAAMKVHRDFDPTLLLVYLPHLDYGLQKLGPGHPDIPGHLRDLDREVSRLLEYLDSRNVRTVMVSEYGIVPVDDAVAVNRVLREAGHITVRNELGRELLDPGLSSAFAVADHQVAHVYVADHERIPEVAELLGTVPGIEQVLRGDDLAAAGLDHDRSGELVLVSDRNRWFCHDWWMHPDQAPDYQRTVDIHRKPGYDPRELFLDPAIRFPRLKIARKLLARKLGFRNLLDVIPLDTSLVRGSHGRVNQALGWDPVLISEATVNMQEDSDGRIPCTAVRDLLLEMLFA